MQPTFTLPTQAGAPAPSPEEAAAIVAAIERFMRATAPGPQPATSPPDPWLRAAILEGVARADGGDAGPGLLEPWITNPG
jgi:hypothetical protein